MIEKLFDTVSMVFTEEGFTSSNCLLVEDTERLIIDSGAGKILASVSPETIDTLLVSHHHLDHISGNDLFTRARIYAHPIEAKAMNTPEKLTATDGWEDLMEGSVEDHAPELGRIVETMPRIFEPWRVDEDLRDGQVLYCGGTEIQVIHTPGHTAGHCSFYFPELEFAFLGDVCLTKVGPWYGDDDSGVDDFIDTINRIIGLKLKKVSTGHIPYIINDNINDVLVEYRDRIHKREERILKFLQQQPAGIHEIAAKRLIYREHPTSFVLFWEKSMVKKHLQRLLALGAIEKYENGSYRAR